MGQLAQKVREKYPNSYKNVSDEELEKQITAKYPGKYDNLINKNEYPPNITLPDGSMISSLYKGEERKDRQIVDTEKLRSGMINFASKTPFPKTVGTIGDLGIQALDLFNDPESVASAGAVGALRKGLTSKVIPEVISPKSVAPVITPPPNTAITGSREVLPVKPEVSKLPSKAEASEIIRSVRGMRAPRPEAPRIRTNDPSAGRDIMAQVEAMPKKMPQVSTIVEEKAVEGAKKIGDEDIGPIRRGLSEARALQTSLDLSAPLRQGISLAHTKEYAKALKPMFKSAWSEDTFKSIKSEIENRPTYALMQRGGVEFTDLTKNLAKREEQLRGTFVEKFLPVKMSNRGYTTFLNKLRADTFDRMIKDSNVSPDDIGGLKKIASFVNDATGRGDLGRFEKSSVLLNDVFFSPKLIASRVNMLKRAGTSTIESITRTGADDAISKQLRKESIKSMIGFGGLGTVSVGMSLGRGAKGTDDIRSTDFGKLRIGNTRIDFTGGFQQYFRTAAQIAAGQASIEGELVDRNRADTAGRFLRNKLSPFVSAVWDLMAGEDVIGRKTSLFPASMTNRGEILDLVTPLIIDDFIEILNEDPKMLPLTAPATFFGAGVQSYGRENKGMPSLKLPSISNSMPPIND